MIFSTERSNKVLSMVYQQRELVRDLCNSSVFITDESKSFYFNLLDYIEKNINKDLYTIPVLRTAIKTDKNEHLLKVVQFFSGGGSKIFNLKYCYELDNMEYVEIAFDEYNNYILHGVEPVTIDGNEIEDFNPKYLSFYCLISLD
jgi:hypothetical protein